MDGAIEVLDILNKNKYKSYLVGGCVRDMIRGVPYNDIDIATPAVPTKVMDIFSKYTHYTCIPTGLKHGTITIIDSLKNKTYEISSFRKDVSCDGRHAEVKFTTDLETDLSRRDFQMNAIAYDPIKDTYIDPFNGRQDIKDKIIRTVGSAKDRFKEDYLRMIRALRFHAVLEFDLHDDIDHAIDALEENITSISKERIREEITKCFSKADKPSKMFWAMANRTNLLLLLLRDLAICYEFKQNRYHLHDVLRHTLLAVDAVPKEYPLIRWAALFHDTGKPKTCKGYGTPEASFHGHEIVSAKIASENLAKLKFSNSNKDYIVNLVRHHMIMVTSEMKDSAVRRIVSKVGVEYINDLCILKWADRKGAGTKTTFELDLNRAALRRRFDAILEKDSAFSIKDLCISGRDIMETFNIKAGPGVGVFLRKAMEVVLDSPEINKDKEKLLGVIKPN